MNEYLGFDTDFDSLKKVQKCTQMCVYVYLGMRVLKDICGQMELKVNFILVQNIFEIHALVIITFIFHEVFEDPLYLSGNK